MYSVSSASRFDPEFILPSPVGSGLLYTFCPDLLKEVE
jgi:hypothetical protein